MYGGPKNFLFSAIDLTFQLLTTYYSEKTHQPDQPETKRLAPPELSLQKKQKAQKQPTVVA